MMFTIYPTKASIGADNTSVMDAFYIEMQADLRWVDYDETVDWYRAVLIGDNEVLVTKIAYDYDNFFQKEEVKTKYCRYTGNPLTSQVMDDYMAGLNADLTRRREEGNRLWYHEMFNYYLLKWPKDIKLSVEMITPSNHASKELGMGILEVVTFQDDPVDSAKFITNQRDRVLWKIAKAESRTFKSGEASTRSSMARKMGRTSASASARTRYQAMASSYNSGPPPPGPNSGPPPPGPNPGPPPQGFTPGPPPRSTR
jgi:hypothetical protein